MTDYEDLKPHELWLRRDRGRGPACSENGILGVWNEDMPTFKDGRAVWRDGQPCLHPGCLSHVSHPCEGCGRIGGVNANKGIKA